MREIQLLPYFGAADASDSGQIIVPDGCGAVIGFHSQKTPVYSQRMYGIDRGRVTEQSATETQPALLPMLAFSYSSYHGMSAGLVLYAEEGAALATANADAESTDGCYNKAYFSFRYREYDEVTFMDRTSSAQKVNLNEKSAVSCGAFRVSYTFLPDKSDYISLAEQVRERVFGGSVPDGLQNSELPVYLRCFMSVRKTKYFLGIPYNGNQTLTTLDNCREMLESFQGMPVVMSLVGTDSDGAVGGRIDAKLKIKSSIGSEKELKQLMEDAQRTGGAVYPVAEFTEFTKGSGSSRVKSVANLTVSRSYFDYGTLTKRDDYDEIFILKNSKILDYINSWIRSAQKKGIAYCAPLSLSDSPYRSGEAANGDRESTRLIFEKALQSFRDNDIKLLTESAAAYAIPYSEHIRSVPVYASGYTACDFEIPFLQLVLHGIKSYSMPSVNLSGNWDTYFLKAIETGSAPDYTFIQADYEEINGTPLDVLNGAVYSLCGEQAAAQAKALSECMKGTANARIIDYRVITPQVRAVAYENGSCFVVNYSDADYSVYGVTVPAKGYKTIGREALK